MDVNEYFYGWREVGAALGCSAGHATLLAREAGVIPLRLGHPTMGRILLAKGRLVELIDFERKRREKQRRSCMEKERRGDEGEA